MTGDSYRDMLNNYLKIALRSILRHPSYTFINVIGLAVGMAVCLLIYLFVQDELSYDRYHDHADRIYRLAVTIDNSTFEEGLAKVADLWGPGAKAEIPEVIDETRFVIMGRTLIGKNARQEYETGGFFADSTTLMIFSWPLVSGDPATALVGPNKMVVTESFADRWFGNADPMGQTLRLDNSDVVTVSGVIRDVPTNSHFLFDYLVSLESYHHENRGDWVRWNQFYTYLLLAPGVQPDDIEQKFDQVLDRHLEPAYAESYYPLLQPLSAIHLHSNLHREITANSDVAYVYVFSAIALLILLIAATNFVSLATARSTKRAHEVGVRKVSGADRWMLIRQFVGESLLLSLVAFALAWGLSEMLIDPFNQLSGKSLDLDLLGDPSLFIQILVGAAVVGVLAGAYPAFFLSSYRPAAVLKGDTAGGGRSGLRKWLVVFQFAISSFLIIATGVVYSQLQYVREKSLGFSKDDLIVVSTNLSETRERFETVMAQLEEHPAIVGVSFSSNQPGGSDWGLPIEIEGFDNSDNSFDGFRVLNVDWRFLDTYQIELAAGRGFSRDFPADTLNYLMNETATKQLGWTLETAKRIGSPRVSRPFGEVIGIVKDFHFRSMHEPITPLLIMMQPQWLTTFNIRIAPGAEEESLAHIERVMGRWEPDFPLTYRFFDQQFDSLHDADARVGLLLTYFAILAIFIACLGLFGLASFTAEQRTKEIGVRKVLGASVLRILIGLSQDTVRLVLIGVAAAIPLAWYAMDRWLANFAYNTGLSWSVFVLGGLLTVGIAIATVSYESLRAAMANPVESLRYE